MHPNTLRNKLLGVIAFPVTPFKEDLSLDLPALHENLTHLLQYQISAIVAAGGTGEMYSLTPAEYTRVIELTALAVEDRVPVIAGVGFGQRLAVEMAQAAEKAGADGILVFLLTIRMLKMTDCLSTTALLAPRRNSACSSTVAIGQTSHRRWWSV